MVTSASIKRSIDATRRRIGRTIHIYTPTKIPCTICTAGGYYDILNDASAFTKCPECHGTFWKNELLDHKVLARVHWTTNEAISITPGGKYFTGDAYAVVDPSYHSIIAAAQENGGKVVIDGQDMTITKISPEGVGTVNRYKIILISSGQRPR